MFLIYLVANGSAIDAKSKYSNEVRLRSAARAMYQNFRLSSCAPRNDSVSQASLQSGLQKLAELERKLQKAPAGQYLTIAREDTRYIKMLSLDCLLDDKSRSIVDQRAERAVVGVQKLSRNVKRINSKVLHVSGDAAAFRFHARHIVKALNPICPYVNNGTNDPLLAPAKEIADRFRREIAALPYTAHFSMAEEDVLYERAMGPVAECAAPLNPKPDQITAQILALVEEEIAEARAAMEPTE